ncbi:MAG: gluconate kinase [Leptolyngbya foveolarum]|uniref:Gluconate kinase n=1 Tax=Leptolyngbya foveolarum TaxID=47253 RepID=A0A2W4UCI0_9CYAN|nr:MAG: gluconate kinase [Leptolyngbya foveolarum]
MNYVVGIDIGTSSTKSVLFDTAGQQIARSAQSYALKSPEPGAAEQDPNDILQAATQTVAEVIASSGIDPAQLLGISFSAAMHTLLLINKENQPITPMYTWADNRSDRWADFVKASTNANSLYQRTGLPAHPMSPLVKLVWLRYEQPELFKQAARIIAIKEYVLWHWCGEWVIDHSMATTTGLLELRSLCWDSEALTLAGIKQQQLSKLVPTTHQLSHIHPDYAQKMGISANTSVVVGASDGVLSNLGVGAISSGTAAITIGTSGAVRQVVNGPITASSAQLFCYALTENLWVMGGAVNNGGIALQWARDSLMPYSIPHEEKHLSNPEPSASTYERLTKMAETVSPGAEGLIFHPYLLGERSPLWNAQARASFFGLGRHHTQAHLVRAVLEGVVYNLHVVFSALEQSGGRVTKLRASGGFARSDLWQQMLADIFNRTIEVPKVIESSALGAAALAFWALGEWDSLEQIEARVEIAQIKTPIAENVRRYRKFLPIYNALLVGFTEQYAALREAAQD